MARRKWHAAATNFIRWFGAERLLYDRARIFFTATRAFFTAVVMSSARALTQAVPGHLRRSLHQKPRLRTGGGTRRDQLCESPGRHADRFPLSPIRHESQRPTGGGEAALERRRMAGRRRGPDPEAGPKTSFSPAPGGTIAPDGWWRPNASIATSSRSILITSAPCNSLGAFACRWDARMRRSKLSARSSPAMIGFRNATTPSLWLSPHLGGSTTRPRMTSAPLRSSRALSRRTIISRRHIISSRAHR